MLLSTQALTGIEHMSDLPLNVLAVYAGVAIWLVFAIFDFKRQSYTPSLVLGTVLLLFLNIRYVIDGVPDSIAFFVALYDVFDNLGLAAGQSAPALATCPANECSVWGERYLNHPSWGVAFHERFLHGPALRSNLLYGHLLLNSIVFVLMHYQLARPAMADNRHIHRLLGRVTFACLTLATICAVWLAAEHGPVTQYGGDLSKFGFWFMSLCVYSCAAMGIVAVRGGDPALHRIWMIRFAGSMWGAFWIFRLMLLVTGPLLRQWESAALLISIWLSAPLGILIAEALRKRSERRETADSSGQRATIEHAAGSQH